MFKPFHAYSVINIQRARDMTEEQLIIERFGKQNPFTVPDGFFEEISSKIISELPARQEPAKVRSMVFRRYAVAASIAAVIIGGAVWFVQPRQNVAVQHVAQTAVAANNTTSNEVFIDQMADYALLDNQDIYSYLADY